MPPENSIGRISRMDAINNKSVVEAALRIAKEKMTELRAMQKKIENSDFGICKKCNTGFGGLGDRHETVINLVNYNFGSIENFVDWCNKKH